MNQTIIKSNRTLFTLLVLAGSSCLVSCSKSASPEAKAAFESVIPKPVTVNSSGKAFFINERTEILLGTNTPEVNAVALSLALRINLATGFTMVVKPATATPQPGAIYFYLDATNPKLGDEGYELTVTEEQIKLNAAKPAGLFHAIQTLRQILPAKIESADRQDGPWEVATGSIIDYPDYQWRGSMLDVARHFYPVEEVKHYIDQLAIYKINILHLHLSDDQGWRIEIKSWPELTNKGGSTQVGGGKGGFYTQEQYKEIVAYAAQQFITIVPEIDMPGHINSALASYAELNAGIPISAEPAKVSPAAGAQDVTPKPIPGVLYTGIEVGFSTLKLEKKATMKFVEDVIREVSAMTPGPYIHIGGDEAHVTKKEEYLVFVAKFAELVKANGKRMVGWDETAQAPLDDQALVQLWHSKEYAQLAAEKGAHLIMSPATKVYLDMQYDSTTRIGLHWAAYTEVDSSYMWDPAKIVSGVTRENIIGVEAPIWGETIRSYDDMEYLVFPRLLGAAEIGWTFADQRVWDEYKVRLGRQAKRLKMLGIDYYPSKRVPWVE